MNAHKKMTMEKKRWFVSRVIHVGFYSFKFSILFYTIICEIWLKNKKNFKMKQKACHINGIKCLLSFFILAKKGKKVSTHWEMK